MRLFRNITAIAGLALVFSAAGYDQMYVEAGQTPPASVIPTLICGLVLLIPMAFRIVGMIKEDGR